MPLSLDELGERGLNTGWRVQLQLQRREYHCFVLSRQLSGRLLGRGQAAPGDDDLVPALFGEQAGCRIAEPEVAPVTSAIECSNGCLLYLSALQRYIRESTIPT